MADHQHSTVVDRPIRTVYDQWTQFETYPMFMDNVREVSQINDTVTRWRVNVAGVEREYFATIIEQRPDELISWAAVDGPRQAGVVTFEPTDDGRTRVTLRLDFEPQGVTERAGDALGVVSASVQKSLSKFKEFIEEQGSASGAWRGEVSHGESTSGPEVDLRGDLSDARTSERFTDDEP